MIKLKDFDVREAMAGADVFTRDGRRVRIVCYNKKSHSDKHIVALVESRDGEHEIAMMYHDNGHLFARDLSTEDLMIADIKRIMT